MSERNLTAQDWLCYEKAETDRQKGWKMLLVHIQMYWVINIKAWSWFELYILFSFLINMLKKPILKGKFWMQCMSNLHIDCGIEITILKQNEMWQKLETVWEMTI